MTVHWVSIYFDWRLLYRTTQGSACCTLCKHRYSTLYRKCVTTTAASSPFSSTRLRALTFCSHRLTAYSDAAEHSRDACSCQNCSSMQTLRGYIPGSSATSPLTAPKIFFSSWKSRTSIFFSSRSPLGNKTNLETFILENLQSRIVLATLARSRQGNSVSVPQIKKVKAMLSLIQAWFGQAQCFTPFTVLNLYYCTVQIP